MVHLVWLIGVLIVVWGLTAVLRPEWIKRVVQFFGRGKNYLIASAIRIVMAIIFLVFAYDTRYGRFILFLGLLFLAGGILLLVLPPAKVHTMLSWWAARKQWAFRVIGIVAVLFGAIIIYTGLPA